jgi:hypothetical protein
MMNWSVSVYAGAKWFAEGVVRAVRMPATKTEQRNAAQTIVQEEAHTARIAAV